ncbi:MAG TPA: NAD(P)-dependent alcohol dehydrogenase [Gemmatimonadaceae bacterium]|nr:NAD(P)-dependent alcohol dehydrogenase [Gemmatimonadaceae bacterium]
MIAYAPTRRTPATARPTTMRAVQFDRFGGPEVLEVRALALPTPRSDEVLVRVHASGLNPKDATVRAGGLGLVSGRELPRGSGFDLAGEVVATGAGVGDLEPGARVWGFLDGYLGGAAAEYAVAPRGALGRMPARLDWIEAAAMPLAASAALQALREGARLRAGDRVLIRGASGGVGSAAIQIASALGAHVTAITTGPGVAHCRALGADAIVDHRAGDLARLTQRWDVMLDCVGNAPLATFRPLLRAGARWCVVAVEPRVYALGALPTALLRVAGLPAFSYLVVRPRARDLDTLAHLVERGLLRMPVAEVYPLEQVRKAHAAIARGHACGKRVLLVSDEAKQARRGGWRTTTH